MADSTSSADDSIGAAYSVSSVKGHPGRTGGLEYTTGSPPLGECAGVVGRAGEPDLVYTGASVNTLFDGAAHRGGNRLGFDREDIIAAGRPTLRHTYRELGTVDDAWGRFQAALRDISDTNPVNDTPFAPALSGRELAELSTSLLTTVL